MEREGGMTGEGKGAKGAEGKAKGREEKKGRGLESPLAEIPSCADDAIIARFELIRACNITL